MTLLVAVLYLLAIILVILAAIGVTSKVDLALLGLAVALLAYSLPAIDAGLVG
jgi:hypothetical protein